MTDDPLGADALAAELPAPYELVRRDRLDSALGEALRLARDGAEEGTLVWAEEQNGVAPGTLCAAVLLRPEEPEERWPELALVAAVSAGGAIAELCQPLTPLRYRWPDGLALGLDAVGGIALTRVSSVLALEWRIHVAPPPGVDPPFATLIADGGAETTPGEVLGRTCRFFLDWINRWAEEGFGPIRRAWLRRGVLGGLPDRTPPGEALDIDARGNLVVRTPGGEITLSLTEALGIERERQP